MIRILRSKIFWIIIIFIIVGGVALARFLISSGQIEYVTQTVEKGSITQTVSATGQVKPSAEIKLSFKTTGRLDILNVKVGDQVIAEQNLAQLRLRDFEINIQKARADLQETNANLKKILVGSTPEDIAISEAEVEQAKTILENAQDDLANAQLIYQQNLDNAEQSIMADIKSALNKVSISLQEVEDTLNYKGDANNFPTTNFSLESKVQSGYDDSIIKLNSAISAHGQSQINPEDDNIDNAKTLSLAVLIATQGTLANLSNLLNFVIINPILTLAELDTLKTAINKELTITDASIISVQDSSQDLFDARINLQIKVADAQNDVTVTEKSLVKVEADLNLTKAPSRPEDVDLARAKVAKAQASLAKAQEELASATLKTLQGGIVTAVNYEVGEQVPLTTPVVELATNGRYGIEVDIPESDIAKIEVGDQVEVTLDAFNDEDVFTASVISINPAETEIQDVIYFKVTIVMDENQLANIKILLDKVKPGMTANITIKTAEVKDALNIPFRAVKEIDGRKVVDILENDQPKQVPVSLGLRGDEGNVEILSGLSAGQQVITFVNEK